MIRILLVRHGESVNNLTDAFSYRLVDHPLTTRGVLQAKLTANHLRSLAAAIVFTSPLRRALQTAKIIAAHCGARLFVKEEFREVNVGELEKSSDTKAAWAIHDAIVDSWRNGNPQAQFPGGEDYTTLAERWSTGLCAACDLIDNGIIIVVGHGGIFRYPIFDLCPLASRALVESRTLTNCSISELVHKNGTRVFDLVRWADDSHLRRESSRPMKPLVDRIDSDGVF